MALSEATLQLLACPACLGVLVEEDEHLECPACRLKFPIQDDIPVLLLEAAQAA